MKEFSPLPECTENERAKKHKTCRTEAQIPPPFNPNLTALRRKVDKSRNNSTNQSVICKNQSVIYKNQTMICKNQSVIPRKCADVSKKK
ncbi:MAG: hypothetical protein IJ901_03945 [Bacteroidaceae bacterium]|nr:hypothetical protein [Bacteroidaceae bacterium]